MKNKQNINILIVDDEVRLAQNLQTLMGWQGYQACLANNGQEAIKMIEQCPPAVVIADLMMPEMDGYQLLAYLHRNFPSIPVVTITGFGSIDSAIKALQMGAFDYILKPFSHDLIIETINRAIIQFRHNRYDQLRHEMTMAVGGTLTLELMMERVLELSIQGVGAENGSLFILSEHGEVMRQILWKDNGQLHTHQIIINQVMKQGINGWLYRNRHSALIPDTDQDDRWLKLPYRPYPVRSVIGLPFVSRDMVQGVMILVHAEIDRFDTLDLQFLESVAMPVAMAIENARLFEREQQKRQEMSAILLSITDVILVVNNQGLILLVNPAITAAFDLEVAAILDQPYEVALGNTALLPVINQVKQENKTLSLEIETLHQRTYYAHVTPVPDVGYVAVLRDITHLKELDKMRVELLSTASQDLKNPLALVQGYIKLLLTENSLNQRQLDIIKRIDRSVLNMTALIRDLLELACLESGFSLQLEPFSINLLAQRLGGEAEKQAQRKNITLTLDLDETLTEVKGDPGRIQQVLDNLLNNAIKYTPSGGKIRLKTLSASAEKGGKNGSVIAAIVSVEDNGYGIEGTHLPYIFDRFYRIKTEKTQDIEGTGLGLAIVKSIVEQHGSQVRVESKVGQGTIFSFTLPSCVLNHSSQFSGKNLKKHLPES